MPKQLHQLTLEQFVELLEKFPFTRQIESVHMHHTWRPNPLPIQRFLYHRGRCGSSTPIHRNEDMIAGVQLGNLRFTLE
jgi:hypothetical protein